MGRRGKNKGRRRHAYVLPRNKGTITISYENVGGDKKIYDYIRTKNRAGAGQMLNDDIICLADVMLPEGVIPQLQGYKSIYKPRVLQGEHCKYGGILILIKEEIWEGVTEEEGEKDHSDIVWFRLKADFFGFKEDVRVAAIYMPPEGSPFLKMFDVPIIEQLRRDLLALPADTRVLIVSDTNGRIGKGVSDVPKSSADDDIEELQDLDFEDFSDLPERNTRETYTGTSKRGQEVLELLADAGLFLLNGRTTGDMEGEWTCIRKKGRSVIDYAIANIHVKPLIRKFEVRPLNPLHQDHCQIAVTLTTDASYRNTPALEAYRYRETEKIVIPWTDEVEKSVSAGLDNPKVKTAFQALQEATNLMRGEEEKQKGTVTQENIDDLTRIFTDTVMASCAVGGSAKIVRTASEIESVRRYERAQWRTKRVRELEESLAKLGRDQNNLSQQWGAALKKLQDCPPEATIKCQKKADDLKREMEALLHRIGAEKKRMKNVIANEKREVQNGFISKLLEHQGSNSSEFWDALKKIRGGSKKQDFVQINPTSLVNHFQNLLASKLEEELGNKSDSGQGESGTDRGSTAKNEPPLSKRPKSRCFDEQSLNEDITEAEVRMRAMKFKNKKASYTDGLSNEIVKVTVRSYAQAYADLFNLIMVSGKYPTQWSEGYLTMLYKKGDKGDPNNYRGLAITSCASKLLNGVINDRMMEQVTDNKLLAPEQASFQKGKRTTDHLFVLQAIIERSLLKGEDILLACVDLSKAYDTVEHTHLFRKLENAGIKGKVLQVLKAMYCNMRYSLKTNGLFTKFFEATRGVKQGDPLSPLLFNIFVDDLQEIFDLDMEGVILMKKVLYALQFADDILLMSTSTKGLQRQLDALVKYVDVWGLKINESKTYIVTTETTLARNERIERGDRLIINGVVLEERASGSYLGVTIGNRGLDIGDSDMAKKTRRAIFALIAYCRLCPAKLAIYIYDKIIIGISLYGSDAWFAAMNQGMIDKHGFLATYGDRGKNMLEADKLRANFLRRILHVSDRTVIEAVRGETGVTHLYPMAAQSCVRFVERILRGEAPTLVEEAFQVFKQIDEEGYVSWYGVAKELMQMTGGVRLHKAKNKEGKTVIISKAKDVRRRLRQEIIQQWYTYMEEARAINSSYKLRTYARIKESFQMEDYLNMLPGDVVPAVTKFRCGDHKLPVESGKFKQLDWQDRVCELCRKDRVVIRLPLDTVMPIALPSGSRPRTRSSNWRWGTPVGDEMHMLSCPGLECVRVYNKMDDWDESVIMEKIKKPDLKIAKYIRMAMPCMENGTVQKLAADLKEKHDINPNVKLLPLIEPSKRHKRKTGEVRSEEVTTGSSTGDRESESTSQTIEANGLGSTAATNSQDVRRAAKMDHPYGTARTELQKTRRGKLNTRKKWNLSENQLKRLDENLDE